MKNDVKDIELLQEKANQFIPLRKEKIAFFSDIVDNGINDPIDTIKKLINLLRAYDDKIEDLSSIIYKIKKIKLIK
ncbi:MAG: hypothetical protein IJK61_06030 [Bacteroidetes bacterium]|nr:hypothetical protein [Bacteroidota bacterium]